MIAIAFVAFAILIVAWLMAPTGEAAAKVERAEPATAPGVALGEATAPIS